MFDKLDDLLIRLEEILSELQEPDVANDQNRFRKLMKEQADLTPIVDAYTEYKNAKQAIIDSEEMLEMESDEEMRELAKEELYESKKRVEELEHELIARHTAALGLTVQYFQALDHLDRDQAYVIRRRYLDGAYMETIADEIPCSPRTAYYYRRKALRTLADLNVCRPLQ